MYNKHNNININKHNKVFKLKSTQTVGPLLNSTPGAIQSIIIWIIVSRKGSYGDQQQQVNSWLEFNITLHND